MKLIYSKYVLGIGIITGAIISMCFNMEKHDNHIKRDNKKTDMLLGKLVYEGAIIKAVREIKPTPTYKQIDSIYSVESEKVLDRIYKK